MNHIRAAADAAVCWQSALEPPMRSAGGEATHRLLVRRWPRRREPRRREAGELLLLSLWRESRSSEGKKWWLQPREPCVRAHMHIDTHTYPRQLI